MKITLLTRYSRLGASSRLRMFQYVPALERAGVEINIAPFFDDEYLTDLYSGRRSPVRTLGYFTRRLKQLRKAHGADLIWIEKEALPWVPWAFERAFLPSDVPYLVDYDDAVFHRYDLHTNPAIRYSLGQKIDSVMAGAACVTVGNDYLADRAHSAGAQRVECVPTVVDMDRYSVHPRGSSVSPVRIGWIGTPKTWKGSAEPVFDILEPVLHKKEARFCAIGAMLERWKIGVLDILPWSEENEVTDIQGFDVGIMPLQDDPWTRGKCGYKLIQYMACGLPVVASPVGMNTELVQHGVNGFLAETDDEWREAIGILLARPEMRAEMGAAGRHKVESLYSLQVWAPQLIEIVRSISRSLKETNIE